MRIISLFEAVLNNPDDIDNCLDKATDIKGLGIAGSSGLLAILFPKYFGTVVQFVVENIIQLEKLKSILLVENLRKKFSIHIRN